MHPLERSTTHGRKAESEAPGPLLAFFTPLSFLCPYQQVQ